MTRSQARRLLKQNAAETSLARVGEAIGQHRRPAKAYLHSQVRAWVTGDKVPSIPSRVAISRWSNGAIPATAWDA